MDAGPGSVVLSLWRDARGCKLPGPLPAQRLRPLGMPACAPPHPTRLANARTNPLRLLVCRPDGWAPSADCLVRQPVATGLLRPSGFADTNKLYFVNCRPDGWAPSADCLVRLVEASLPQLDSFSPESFCAMLFSLACLRMRPGERSERALGVVRCVPARACPPAGAPPASPWPACARAAEGHACWHSGGHEATPGVARPLSRHPLCCRFCAAADDAALTAVLDAFQWQVPKSNNRCEGGVVEGEAAGWHTDRGLSRKQGGLVLNRLRPLGPLTCPLWRRQLVTVVWSLGALQITPLITESLWDDIERQLLQQVGRAVAPTPCWRLRTLAGWERVAAPAASPLARCCACGPHRPLRRLPVTEPYRTLVPNTPGTAGRRVQLLLGSLLPLWVGAAAAQPFRCVLRKKPVPRAQRVRCL